MPTESRSLTDVQPEVAASAPGPPPPAGPPAMSPVELGRWAWRQLTSMRTALLLLFLLALAAIPGSVVPQEAVDSLRASRWRKSRNCALMSGRVPSRCRSEMKSVVTERS